MKVRLKSKLGRPFWRFGTKLSPDRWTTLDVSDEQLITISDAFVVDEDGPRARTLQEGGALEIEPAAEVVAEIQKARLRVQAAAIVAADAAETERRARSAALDEAVAALRAAKPKK